MKKEIIEIPDLTGRTLIILERQWWVELLAEQKLGEVFHVISLDRNLILSDDFVFLATQGASISASLIERAIRAGIKKVIRIGTTGSLRDNLDLFSIVLPIAVYKEEGTSPLYVDPSFPCIPDLALVDIVAGILGENNFGVKKGITWTTDGRWTESLEKMIRLKEEGVLAVDMETSAIFTVCQKRRIPAVAINIVTDYPLGTEKDGLHGIPENYHTYVAKLTEMVSRLCNVLSQGSKKDSVLKK